MRCDRCGRDNPDHLSFCEDCGYNLKPARKDLGGTVVIRPVSSPNATPGQGLQRPQAPPLKLGERPEPAVARAESWQACQVCQTRNQLGHRFCVACGSPLAAEPPPRPEPAPAARPEPAPRPAPEPVAAPAPVAAPKPAPQPVAVAAPVPVAAPAPVPVAAPAPVPVAAPVAAPALVPVAQSSPVPTTTAVLTAAAVQPAPERPPQPPPQPAPAPAAAAAPAAQARAARPTAPDGIAALARAQERAQAQAARGDALAAAPVVPLAEPAQAPPRSVTCPRCRTVSEAGVPYCQVCGQSLGAAGKDEADRGVPPPVPSRELRAVAPVAPAEGDPSARTDQYVPLTAARTLGRMVLLAKDGSDGATFPITSEQVDIGSREGSVILNDDPYLSPRHARLVREGGQWYVVDLGSVNGVYLKVRGRRSLADGDLILLGQQVLRFEVVMDAEQALRPAMQHGVALFGTPQAPRHARLCQRTVEGVTRDVYNLYRPEVSLGRETADIVFGDDPFLSRRHAVVRLQAPNASSAASPAAAATDESSRLFTIEDAGSSNGTFVAIRGRERLTGGEVLRVGLHLFRVELADNERGMHS